MKTIELNLYEFNELSKAAQLVAKDELHYHIEDCVQWRCDEIKASYEAFKRALSSNPVTGRALIANSCPFTGVCYDEDFIDLVRNHWSNDRKVPNVTEVSKAAQQLYSKLRTAEIRYVNSDEHIQEMCVANDIYFIESGKIYDL